MSSIALARLRGAAKRNVNFGALTISFLTGTYAYWNWRFKIKKEFLLGFGNKRLEQKSTNGTPYDSQFLSWYRMPEQEYDYYRLFHPYYVIGQLDYTKEVLIPKDKVINGATHKGFDIINPLYCYDGGTLMTEKTQNTPGAGIGTDRAAIIVNRGWIPYHLKDKKNRLWEKNSRQLTRIEGTFVMAKDIHDYKIPNNPSNNEWHNLAPEDLARFWELPNQNEIKQFYFQRVNLEGTTQIIAANQSEINTYPLIKSKDEVVRDHYDWWTSESWNKLQYYAFTPISVFSAWVFFLTM